MLLHHELKRDGPVVRVYVNGELTSLTFSNEHELRLFLKGPDTTDEVVEQRMRELATTGRTEFDV